MQNETHGSPGPALEGQVPPTAAPETGAEHLPGQDQAEGRHGEPPVGGEHEDATTTAGEEAPSVPGDATGAAAPEQQAPTLAEVLLAVEELWPESLAEDWDKVGLVTGRPEQPVHRIQFAVDPTEEVVQEAVDLGVDLLITHHPLLLRGVSSVAATTAKGRVIHRLIENGVALLTVHTNGDSAVGGVSDVIADALDLHDREPLTAARNGLPEEGVGRVGALGTAVTLADLAARLCGFLPSVAGGVRVAGDRDALVQRVAICGGAGDSLLDDVRARQADVYITADLRHHPASEARETARGGRPYLIDVSHFASEWLWLPAAAQALDNVLEDQGFPVEIGVSGINTDPWDFILTPHGDGEG
ncbi:Nif3-like dinuclear metal center hexameric protein [Arthrobacter woluwensis]|uniref:Nif3-like dinuclear metal center hexameric protein n=1 Tax=Arthrobacter woluwensis TaxID=156980 RepID=UPI000D12343E|nr:Nif3-like dinuclear metal center hexameric protein [Arthrobacter woluwensis]PSS44850.1 Nif3-like dinuclear metal center hexameric protein [Arthrobacter woluwensis]